VTGKVDGRGAAIDASIVVPFIIFTLIWGSTWIIIRDQLGVVPSHWSVAYRFGIAAVAMAAVAKWQGFDLRPSRGLLACAAVLGAAQFSINFGAVYQAEHYITSGVVATMFALLIIPNSLLAWVFLGQRPGGAFLAGGAVAVAGVVLLSINEWQASSATTRDVVIGLGWTIFGLLGSSVANVFQATERPRRYPLPVLLAWGMALGTLFDVALAWTFSGPPVWDPRPAYWLGLLYLSLAASVLCFSLYFPVIRKIGPGKAAYSSVMVPVIAMALSTVLEGYHWTTLAVAGAVLSLGGILIAIGLRRRPLPAAAPDAG
jgi:drug/metabolite transporter (DMT)-like permease